MTFREYLANDRDSGLDRTGIYSRHRKLVYSHVRRVLHNKEKDTENPRLFNSTHVRSSFLTLLIWSKLEWRICMMEDTRNTVRM